MKRRTFIKTTGALGLGAALPWADAPAQDGPSLEFLRKKTSDRMLFPRPHDGAEVKISPVGLAWLSCPSAVAYRVDIFDEGGRRAYSGNAGKDSVHCPDRVLSSGTYTWDVVALDDGGKEIAQRGKRSFTISQGAAPLPWVEPKALLAKVAS